MVDLLPHDDELHAWLLESGRAESHELLLEYWTRFPERLKDCLWVPISGWLEPLVRRLREREETGAVLLARLREWVANGELEEEQRASASLWLAAWFHGLRLN